jgi:hypothetical protein
MKKKEILDDLEIYVDPKPLTKDEELGLSLFIRQLKEKKALRPTPSKQNLRRKAAQI